VGHNSTSKNASSCAPTVLISNPAAIFEPQKGLARRRRNQTVSPDCGAPRAVSDQLSAFSLAISVQLLAESWTTNGYVIVILLFVLPT
jgi:hypothetical protein